MELEQASAHQTAMPRIQDYVEFRKYLADWFAFKKKMRSGFSHRVLAQKLGLASPNFILLVIKGERNISTEMAQKLSVLMLHTKMEGEYFQTLIRLDTVESVKEKSEARKTLLRLSRKLSTSVMDKKQVEIVNSWQHMLVRECIFLQGFQPTVEYVVEKLDQLVTEEEAEASISLLIKRGYWQQEASGKWIYGNPILDTGDAIFAKERMEELHSQTLKKWSQWLETLDPNFREMGLLYIPIHSGKIPELKERIRQFQDEIIGWLQDETEANELVQLGTYLIPMKKAR